MSKSKRKRSHMFVPDCQNRPGIPVNHILAAANYAADRKPDVIILAGDWWDLPSLSSYEKPGSSFFDGVSLNEDIEHGNTMMDVFLTKIRKKRGYSPEIHFLMGNHEARMDRAIRDEPTRLNGILGQHLFHLPSEVHVHQFLEIVRIDGIMYSHYFVNPQSALRNALGGQMDNRLNKLKGSFTQGHVQTLQWGAQDLPGGQRIIGCVAGAFYQHEEEYAGPQGQNYWRGIVMKHEVHGGEYDPMMVSISYLLENYL